MPFREQRAWRLGVLLARANVAFSLLLDEVPDAQDLVEKSLMLHLKRFKENMKIAPLSCNCPITNEYIKSLLTSNWLQLCGSSVDRDYAVSLSNVVVMFQSKGELGLHLQGSAPEKFSPESSPIILFLYW